MTYRCGLGLVLDLLVRELGLELGLGFRVKGLGLGLVLGLGYNVITTT